MKFKNLYKFCHLKSGEDKDRDKNITFKNNQTKIKRVISILRDFGNSIEIWLDDFLDYIIVLVHFLELFPPYCFDFSYYST